MNDWRKTSRNLRRSTLENIVTESRASVLVAVVDEDPAYVVGYYADIRGIPVNTELVRFAKADIVLRLQVREELKPFADSLTYSQRKEDRS